MRIATYNIWNSATDRIRRLEALCEELERIDADVVALQEVPAMAWEGSRQDVAHLVSERIQYHFVVFHRYPGDGEEGLAFLSKLLFRSVEAGWEASPTALRDCGLRVEVEGEGAAVAITNVHLDYKSIAVREAQIVSVSEWVAARAEPPCLEILCGDFNCYPESSVYRFLMGEQTLEGKAGPVWHDLAAYHAHRTGSVPSPTLDFATNPRWAGEVSLALPARFDWLLLQERWPLPAPSVSRVELFGRSPTPITGVVPSDHYGVFADIGA